MWGVEALVVFGDRALLETGSSQSWPSPWVSSHLSTTFIYSLLKITGGMHVWEKKKLMFCFKCK